MQEILQMLFGEVSPQQMKQFNEELGKRFVSKVDFNAKTVELNAMRERMQGVEEAEALQNKLDALQKRYDKEVRELSAQLKQADFDHALDQALSTARARNPKAVRGLLNMKELSFEGETVEGLEEQLKAIRQSDPYLFEGAAVHKASAGSRGNFARAGMPSVSREQFSQMNYAQRMELYSQNRPLYQQLTEEQ